MRFKYTSFITPVIIILVTIILSFCLSACGSRDAEIRVLQQQVEMLATQNALLAELRQESTNAEVADEVVAPPPPAVEQDIQVEIIEPAPEKLPDGPVPAGTTVFYDGWALTISNDIKIRGDQIYLTFTIRNTSDKTRIFRYVKSGVELFDNQGNQYPMKPWKDCPDHFNITQQMSLKPGEGKNIDSYSSSFCHSSRYLSYFEGRISLNASYLVITIDDWGPFSGVVFHMDL